MKMPIKIRIEKSRNAAFMKARPYYRLLRAGGMGVKEAMATVRNFDALNFGMNIVFHPENKRTCKEMK